VTRASVREYLATQRQRYRLLARRERSQLLNEIVAVTGYHRKAVLRRLRELPRRRAGGKPVGRPRRYGADVAQAAQVLWEAAGQIGAKRLQPSCRSFWTAWWRAGNSRWLRRQRRCCVR
jgi:hypothetical protein